MKESEIIDARPRLASAVGHWLRGNRHEQEDALSRAILSAFLALRGPYSYDRASTYTILFTIAYRRSMDELKYLERRRNQYRLISENEPFPTPEPGPEELYERKQRRERVLEAVQELSPRQKKVILLRYFWDMDTTETAKVIGRSRTTTLGRLKDGRRELKWRLSKEAL